jgi:hypothetical protein
MRSALKITIVFLFGLLIFMSCKNDLKIVAPYKEIPQVHAIITPQEPMQMIRINKIFLGEGDATVMAQQPDSVNYQPGELTVWLERYSGANKIAAEMVSGKTEVYFRDSVIQLEPGAFSTTQRVYVCNDKLYSNGLYKLFIKNNHTGNLFSASANALDSMNLTGFSPFTTPVFSSTFVPSPTVTAAFIDYSNQNVPNNIRTKAVSGGFIHDLTIRIHYYDSISSSPSAPNGGKDFYTYDFVFFPKQLSELQDIGNTKYFVFSFRSPALLEAFGIELARRANPPFGRKVFRIDFMTYAASQEYYDYLQFSAPSLSFSQEKVLYSNFENKAAIGIFTFKSRCLVGKFAANGFIDEFANNKYTCNLGFWKNDISSGQCP